MSRGEYCGTGHIHAKQRGLSGMEVSKCSETSGPRTEKSSNNSFIMSKRLVCAASFLDRMTNGEVIMIEGARLGKFLQADSCRFTGLCEM